MNGFDERGLAGSWQSYNVNPKHKRVGDCTVRAIATALGQDWYTTFFDLCALGAKSADMPSSDAIWGEYLRENGFRRSIIPCDDRFCTTIKDFCRSNPEGIFIVCPKSHVVAVVDGLYFDTWDSGDEVVLYYWRKE